MAAAKKAPGQEGAGQEGASQARPPQSPPQQGRRTKPAAKKAAVEQGVRQGPPAKRAAKSAAKQATEPPAKRGAGRARRRPSKRRRPPRRSPAEVGATPSTASRRKAPATKAADQVERHESSVDVRHVAAAASQLPEPRGVSKDGIAYTKDFDVKFLKAQRDLLDEEKAKLIGQATRLEDEANSLIEEAEMGDVQFDDEGGEGDTMVVERERDLALSAQARQTIADIDAALARLGEGHVRLLRGSPAARSHASASRPFRGRPMLVEEKVGGIGRR